MSDIISDSSANTAAEAVRLGDEASMNMLKQIAHEAAKGYLKETQITAYSRAIEQLRKNLGVKEKQTTDTEINVVMGEDGEDYAV